MFSLLIFQKNFCCQQHVQEKGSSILGVNKDGGIKLLPGVGSYSFFETAFSKMLK
jgi:hypothetical protein